MAATTAMHAERVAATSSRSRWLTAGRTFAPPRAIWGHGDDVVLQSSRAPSSARGWASPSTSRRARTPLNWGGTQVHPRQKRSSSGTTKSVGTLGFRLAIAPNSMARRSACLDPDLRSNDPRHAAEMDAALRELVGGMEPTVRTGSGGSHFYFVMDGKDLPTRTLVLRQSKDEVEWRKMEKPRRAQLGRSSSCGPGMLAHCRHQSIPTPATRTNGSMGD